MALGWPYWQLEIEDKNKNSLSEEHKSLRQLIREAEGGKKTKRKSLKQLIKEAENEPLNKLKKGVAGVAHKDGTIEIAPDLSPKERKLTMIHEQQHQIDMKSGKLNYDKNFVYYNGRKYARKNGKIVYNGKAYKEGDPKLPWEKRAYKAEKTRKFLYA